MTLQVDFLWFVGMLLAFFGACAGVGKVLLGQTQKHLDEKFEAQEKARTENHAALSGRLDSIETANKKEADQWQRIERDFLLFKADLPVQYVRREDYIRGQSVIEAKLDGLATRVENLQLRSIINGGNHGNN